MWLKLLVQLYPFTYACVMKRPHFFQRGLLWYRDKSTSLGGYWPESYSYLVQHSGPDLKFLSSLQIFEISIGFYSPKWPFFNPLIPVFLKASLRSDLAFAFWFAASQSLNFSWCFTRYFWKHVVGHVSLDCSDARGENRNYVLILILEIHSVHWSQLQSCPGVPTHSRKA